MRPEDLKLEDFIGGSSDEEEFGEDATSAEEYPVGEWRDVTVCTLRIYRK